MLSLVKDLHLVLLLQCQGHSLHHSGSADLVRLILLLQLLDGCWAVKARGEEMQKIWLAVSGKRKCISKRHQRVNGRRKGKTQRKRRKLMLLSEQSVLPNIKQLQ